MYRPLADDGIVRRIVGAAGAAPSIHNTQPWRFKVVSDDLIELHGDPDRMLWVADPRGRALHLSCGAALFNLRLAIRMSGAKPLVWPLPDPRGEPTLLASVQLAEGRPASLHEHEMFDAIGQRHTSRAPFSERPVPESVQIELEQEAGAEFAVLRMLSVRDTGLVLELAAAADQALAADFDHRVELAQWIGDSPTTAFPPARWAPARTRARRRSGTSPTPRPPSRARRALRAAAAACGAVHRARRAGRLAAGRAGAAAGAADGHPARPRHVVSVPAGRAAGHARPPGWWPWPEHPQIILRFGYGPPAAGTPRRPVDDILERPGPDSAARGPGRA